MLARSRSVRNGPGSRLLMVTLCRATCRASPPTNPVSPARAPLLMPSVGIGDFTEAEVMLTMRPKRRAIMPSTVALISAIGVSMLASSARIQSSRSHSRKSPGGGPPGVVHQDVGRRARGQRRRPARLGGDVPGNRGDAWRRSPPGSRVPSAPASRRRARGDGDARRPPVRAPWRRHGPAPCWRRKPGPSGRSVPCPSCYASVIRWVVAEMALADRRCRQPETRGRAPRPAR